MIICISLSSLLASAYIIVAFIFHESTTNNNLNIQHPEIILVCKTKGSRPDVNKYRCARHYTGLCVHAGGVCDMEYIQLYLRKPRSEA